MYCLKSTKTVGDIDLKNVLQDDEQYSRIKRFYNIDSQNTLIIIADLENEEAISKFEEKLNTNPDMFTICTLQKLKEIKETSIYNRMW